MTHPDPDTSRRPAQLPAAYLRPDTAAAEPGSDTFAADPRPATPASILPADAAAPALPAAPAPAGSPGPSDRGGLLFEYRPPRAHPIVYAGLLLFAFVFITGSIENLLRDNRPAIYLLYAAPMAITALALALWWPSDVRIHRNGIAPSRPLVLRWHRPFIRFDRLACIYPSYYDVTGAFVSPFASSDGKVTQLGLALEEHDGRVETLRFTPTRFQMWQPESRGYLAALDVVKSAWGGRPLVPHAEAIGREEAEAMLAEANRPFLPFFAIVLLFASAAPILWLLHWIGLPVPIALGLSLVAPVGVSLRSFVQSRRRHAILDRLSKAAEHRRGLQDARHAVDAGPATQVQADRRPEHPAARLASAGGGPEEDAAAAEAAADAAAPGPR